MCTRLCPNLEQSENGEAPHKGLEVRPREKAGA